MESGKSIFYPAGKRGSLKRNQAVDRAIKEIEQGFDLKIWGCFVKLDVKNPDRLHGISFVFDRFEEQQK